MSARPRSNLLSFFCLLILIIPFQSALLHAGPYSDSAHGQSSGGVSRSGLSQYADGNCSHCHEQHASIEGQEPGPASGTASPFGLFAGNNLPAASPYSQENNFCFYCHTSSGSQQSGGVLTNRQYSNTYGGYDIDSATGILEAFNLSSYHNLADVQSFAASNFPANFNSDSNACSACHNPHRAKKHKAHPSDPSYTTISRPSDHEELWGDEAGERMNNYVYRPPFFYGSSTSYEPGGVPLHDGSLMPDYNAFCLDCHQYEVPVSTPGVSSMDPSTSAGHLSAIDWGPTGDMHGARARIHAIDGSPKGFGTVIAPYDLAPVESNYVLSCLDCHDPHASVLVTVSKPSTYLFRKEINNNQVTGCGPGNELYFCENDFCLSCHTVTHSCGGPQGCFGCHYHGAENKLCGPWTGPNF